MSILAGLAPRPLAPPPPGPDGRVPAAPRVSPVLALGMLGAVMASFLSNLDTRLTTFALADLRGGRGYGVDEAAWVTAAYNLAEIAIVPLTPWMSAILSPRRAIAGSLALMTLAGAACPAAPDYSWLIVCRFFQGIGGGALIPLLLGTLLRFMPPRQRIWGFAAYAFVTTFTPLISETLSGVLTEYVGWQTIFWVGVVPGAVTFFLVLIGLPVEPMKPELFETVDYPGMALVVLAVSTLNVALDEGQRLDWFSSTTICTLFLTAGLALAGFVVRELTTARPLMDLTLLRRGNFSGGLIVIVAFAAATLATSYVLPQYGTQIRGFRELQVGDILLWVALVQIVMAPAAALLLTWFEARLVLTLGLLLATVGSRMATFITADWVEANLLPPLLIQASSYPLIMVSLILIATSTLQPKDAPTGSALFNIMRSLAGTTGSAVVGAIITVRERVHSATMIDHVTAGAPVTVLRQAMGGLPGIARAVRQQATVMACADAYGWLAVATLATMGVVLLLRETRVAGAPEAPAGLAPGLARAPLLAAILLAVLLPVAGARAGAFEDALGQSYLTNPQLEAERRHLREIDENVPRALSGWRPSVTIEGSIGASAIQDTFDTVHDPERRLPQVSGLTVTQPVYTGGRVTAQVAQAEALTRAERSSLKAAESSILLAAATAFLDVARDQQIVALNVNQVTVLERTARASDQQRAVGALSEADVAQSKARLADGRSALDAATAQAARSRATFEAIVGAPPGALTLPSLHTTPPQTREAAAADASSRNFDVAAARDALAASLQGIDVARAGFLPKLSIEGSVERVKETDVQQLHQRDNIGELALMLSVPLYRGGEVDAETRQAHEAAARARLQIDVMSRQAIQEADTAWDQRDAAEARVHEQEDSVAANDVALRGITRQHEAGARTLLEVLNAQQELLGAKVNLVSARHDELLAELQLQAAVGALTAENLGLSVPIYDPLQHYDAVRDRWIGTDLPPR